MKIEQCLSTKLIEDRYSGSEVFSALLYLVKVDLSKNSNLYDVAGEGYEKADFCIDSRKMPSLSSKT